MCILSMVIALMLASGANDVGAQSVNLRTSKDVYLNSPGVLHYERLGIVFSTGERGRGIVEVMVQPPDPPRPGAPRAVGENEIIPGVGAFGIRLGWSEEQLRAAGCKPPPGAPRQLEGLTCDLDQDRRLYLRLENGRVSWMTAYGDFRTPEGVTHRSNTADILRAYGEPDVYWESMSGRRPAWGFVPIVLIPCLGLVSGFAIRWLRKRPTGVSWQIARAALVGATISCMAATLSSVGAPALGHLPFAVTLAAFVITTSTLSGALAASILETVRIRSRSLRVARYHSLALIVIGLLTLHALLGLALWIGTDTGAFALAPLAGLNGLFSISMWLSADGLSRRYDASGNPGNELQERE